MPPIPEFVKITKIFFRYPAIFSTKTLSATFCARINKGSFLMFQGQMRSSFPTL